MESIKVGSMYYHPEEMIAYLLERIPRGPDGHIDEDILEKIQELRNQLKEVEEDD